MKNKIKKINKHKIKELETRTRLPTLVPLGVGFLRLTADCARRLILLWSLSALTSSIN